MLIWLVDLSEHVKFFNLFRYITFRTGGALFTSALIVFLFGPRIITSLRNGARYDATRGSSTGNGVVPGAFAVNHSSIMMPLGT